MSEYWLKGVNLEKISQLSKMLLSEGFEVIEKNVSDFAQRFEPGAWEKKDLMAVRMYGLNYPIFIDTRSCGGNIKKEPGYNTIKKIFEVVEAEKIVNVGETSVYSPSFF